MKITPLLAGAMSGSMGGVTASRNRAGQYLRRRAIPVNPSTPHRSAVRNNFAALSQLWNTTLTDSQRDGWRTYAANTPHPDVLGNQVQRTGQAAFIRGSLAVQAALSLGLAEPLPGSLAIRLAPPTVFNTGQPVVAITAFDLEIGGTEFTAVANIASVETAIGLASLYIGRPQPTTNTYFRGPWALATIQTIPVGNTAITFDTTMADPASYIWPSPDATVPLQADLAYPLRITISYADGRYSTEYIQTVVLNQLV